MRGGTEATVTDALVVLGYLNQTALLGGACRSTPTPARAAVQDKVAEPLGLSLERAALGIFNIINANMIGGIRSVSVERGTIRATSASSPAAARPPRTPAGSPPTSGSARCMIPRVASGLCAFGEAVADVKHTYLASYTVRFPRSTRSASTTCSLDSSARDATDLEAEGFSRDEIYVERSVDMKYVDQVHECRVEIPLFTIDERGSPRSRTRSTAATKRSTPTASATTCPS